MFLILFLATNLANINFLSEVQEYLIIQKIQNHFFGEHCWIFYNIRIINPLNPKPIFIMKVLENIPLQLTVELSSFLPTKCAKGYFFCFIHFSYIKGKCVSNSLSDILMLFSKFYFFSTKAYHFTFNYIFENLLQMLYTQIKLVLTISYIRQQDH